MRTEKNFEHKGAADRVLSQAMGTMGPAVLLNALPLNLEPADRSVHPHRLMIQVSFTHPLCRDIRQAGREPRAFLLPLLAQPHPSLLQHFVSYFVPLSERMFNLQQNSESENRQSEVKLWTVLIAQIWAGSLATVGQKRIRRGRQTFSFSNSSHLLIIFPSTQAFTPAFSQMLSQILYTQVELRSFVLRALSVLVDSNVAVASQDRCSWKNSLRPSAWIVSLKIRQRRTSISCAIKRRAGLRSYSMFLGASIERIREWLGRLSLPGWALQGTQYCHASSCHPC
jgi:ribosomal RNA-processing protein 12